MWIAEEGPRPESFFYLCSSLEYGGRAVKLVLAAFQAQPWCRFQIDGRLRLGTDHRHSGRRAESDFRGFCGENGGQSP